MGVLHQSEREERGPLPPDLQWPRYSSRAFPDYRFVPGFTPHPRRDPRGHSYGRDEPGAALCSPERWPESEAYLVGVDLYNFAYWWECHEIFEVFWHAVGRSTEQGHFFQGLIHVAAANLKAFMRNRSAVRKLSEAALRRLRDLPPHYMGVSVISLRQEVRDYADGVRDKPALIRLQDECGGGPEEL